MKKLLFLILLIFCAMCKINAAGIKPPIQITFKASYNLFDMGYIMEIHNLSAKRIFCTVYVSGKSTYYSLGISPYGKGEVGYSKLRRNFHSGDRGWIKVEGYLKKIKYSLDSDSYIAEPSKLWE